MPSTAGEIVGKVTCPTRPVNRWGGTWYANLQDGGNIDVIDAGLKEGLFKLWAARD